MPKCRENLGKLLLICRVRRCPRSAAARRVGSLQVTYRGAGLPVCHEGVEENPWGIFGGIARLGGQLHVCVQAQNQRSELTHTFFRTDFALIGEAQIGKSTRVHNPLFLPTNGEAVH